MTKPDIIKLIAGPYRAPDVQPGDVLDDARYGEVEVGGWTNAPIPWPRIKKTGKHAPILTGDLIRAVKVEAASAVAHHWGVGEVTVWSWRKALGVPRTNAGTRRLYEEYKPLKLTPEAVSRGLVSIAIKHPPQAPGPNRSESMRLQWADGRRRNVGAWSHDEMLTLLTWHVMDRRDREIAAVLGRGLHAVRAKRRELMRTKYNSVPPAAGRKIAWKQYDHLLGLVLDATIATLAGCTASSVAKKRKELGIPPYGPSPWPRIDWSEYDHLLGTMPDQALADRIGCTVTAVYTRRNKLGIPPYGGGSWPRIDWSKYDHLLGTMPDQVLADRIGHGLRAVNQRRNKLGIPPFRNRKK